MAVHCWHVSTTLVCEWTAQICHFWPDPNMEKVKTECCLLGKKHSMQIFRVGSFFKLQKNTYTTVK